VLRTRRGLALGGASAVLAPTGAGAALAATHGKLAGEKHGNDIDYDDTVELVDLPTARHGRLSPTVAAALAYGAPR
jgi:hypothetical protein